MTSTASRTAILLIACLGFSSSVRAQQPKRTLDDILQRLEANLNHYNASLPSLFCDEHVLSSQTEPRQRDQTTTTDSVFRLKRSPNSGASTTFVESREIKLVDGKPPASQQLDGPSVLSGAFDGGLAVISRDQAACMKYELERVNKKRDTYIIRFATDLTPRNTADCLLQERTTGRAFIDPATMQITRLELTTPRHLILAGSPYTQPVTGPRVLTVDYAPVRLGGDTFSLPTAITSRNTGNAGSFDPIVWTFQATYRNYHKLEVTSRIVPAAEPPAP